MIRDVAPRFENRLFLSATPHNGHSNSFASLLELLDPQRFTRGVAVTDGKQRDAVMVRRLKEDLRVLDRGSYPLRKLVRHGLQHDGTQWMGTITVGDVVNSSQSIGGINPFELELATLLSEYTDLRDEVGKAGKLALVNLQKRLLSGVAAFSKTLKKHTVGKSGVKALKEIKAAGTSFSGRQCLRSGTPMLMLPRCEEKTLCASSAALMSSYFVTDQKPERFLSVLVHITGASCRIRL